MKTIGIIGGFGPEATAQFYLSLVEATRNIHKGRQPQLIVRNVSVPRVLEHDALKHGRKIRDFIPFLTTAAKELERSGANVLVLPCNTLHLHEDAIRNAVSIPFISIIASTVDLLRRRHIARLGILGSKITIRENLFKRLAPDMAFVTVNKAVQARIDAGLDRFVATNDSAMLRASLKSAFSFLAHEGIRDTLVACTDFHSLCPNIPGITVHDTLQILVEATVAHTCRKQQTEYAIV